MVSTGVFLILLLLEVGCNRNNNCGYAENSHMMYNEQTKECECVNWDADNIYPLSGNHYNSISSVRRNFDYYVKSISDYPYFAHNGDTVLTWGFIIGDDENHLYEFPVIPIGGNGSPYLDIVGFNFFDNIDICDTFYVTGVIEFPSLSSEELVQKKSDQCFLVDYVLRIIDIHHKHSRK